MATHLVKQGYPVKGFDVFLESLERFQGAGGMPTTSLADSASESDYYICMVATAIQAQAALFEQTDSIVKGQRNGFLDLRQVASSQGHLALLFVQLTIDKLCHKRPHFFSALRSRHLTQDRSRSS